MNKENLIYCDTTKDEQVGQAQTECSSICHDCEYVEYLQDGEVLRATCDLKDDVCPDVGVKICPAAKIIYELYFKDVWQSIEWLTLDSVHVYHSDHNSIIKSVDNFLSDDCNCKRYGFYTEKRLSDEYSKIAICLDCGKYKLIRK